jgi:hypothetical protein
MNSSIPSAARGRSRCLALGAAALLGTAALLAAVRPALAAAAQSTAAPAPRTPQKLGPGEEWASWINRDIEIDLQNLPHPYGCDELWYKVRAILLAIGAREYMSITPYDCGKGAPHDARAPSLHLRFQTLRVVTGKDIYWANTRAVKKTVVLAPGEPKRLDADDCALVQQLEGTLFAYLDLKADTSRFQCAAPRSGHDFDLTVQALTAVPQNVASTTSK